MNGHGRQPFNPALVEARLDTFNGFPRARITYQIPHLCQGRRRTYSAEVEIIQYAWGSACSARAEVRAQGGAAIAGDAILGYLPQAHPDDAAKLWATWGHPNPPAFAVQAERFLSQHPSFIPPAATGAPPAAAPEPSASRPSWDDRLVVVEEKRRALVDALLELKRVCLKPEASA